MLCPLGLPLLTPSSRRNSPSPWLSRISPPSPIATRSPENDRLAPIHLSADIAAMGGKGYYLADNAATLAQVKAGAKSGDVVAVLSNGGFGGIHKQLLEQL